MNRPLISKIELENILTYYFISGHLKDKIVVKSGIVTYRILLDSMQSGRESLDGRDAKEVGPHSAMRLAAPRWRNAFC